MGLLLEGLEVPVERKGAWDIFLLTGHDAAGSLVRRDCVTSWELLETNTDLLFCHIYTMSQKRSPFLFL